MAKQKLRCNLALLVAIFAGAQCSTQSDDSTSALNANRWIVTWESHVAGTQLTQTVCTERTAGINCTATYHSVLNGFTADFTKQGFEQFKKRYKSSISVIEQDVGIFTFGDNLYDSTHGGRRLAEQENATWGLDILDQQDLPLDHIYHYTNNGTGVHVYVLDTGIRATHQEFRFLGSPASDGPAHPTRVIPGFSAFGTSTDDCHSHGSHVAAIIGGVTYGVAKNVTLVPVQVLDCSGGATASTIIRGLDWVARNLQLPAVVHMSIEGNLSPLVNGAVQNLMSLAHVPVVVAAGNRGQDACYVSPASTPGAVTVAAIGPDRQRWQYSNWGACVDIHAPGVNITSALRGSDSDVGMKTGTSMAAPFVSGIVALYLELHPGASDSEVIEKVYFSSLIGDVTDNPVATTTSTNNNGDGQAVSEKEGYLQALPVLPTVHGSPNRMLFSTIKVQAVIKPSVIDISSLASSTQMTQQVQLNLTQNPSHTVYVNITSPTAWDGQPLAISTPQNFTLERANDSSTPSATITLAVGPHCAGTFFVAIDFTSEDPFFDGATQAVKVIDGRPVAGNSPSNARNITNLPFTDSASTVMFGTGYSSLLSAANTQGDPLVVQAIGPGAIYRYHTPLDGPEYISISTCGSNFDTVLIVVAEGQPQVPPQVNDDDPSCASSTSNSRLDMMLQPGATYMIIVKGYNTASGTYKLSVVKSSQ